MGFYVSCVFQSTLLLVYSGTNKLKLAKRHLKLSDLVIIHFEDLIMFSSVN